MFAQLERRLDARFEQIDARFEQADARFERLEARLTNLEAKLVRYSLDLLLHDADPRAHNRRRGYQVKEEEANYGDLDPFHQFDPEFRKRLVEAGKSLDASADEVRAYCVEKGIELPTSNTEAMIRLIQESRCDKVEQELNKL